MTGRQRVSLAGLTVASAAAALLAGWMLKGKAPPGGPEAAADSTATASTLEIVPEDAAPVAATSATPAAPHRTAEALVGTGSTVVRTLKGLGLSAGEAQAVIDAARPAWDPAKVAAGTRVLVTWTNETDTMPTHVSFRLDDTRTLSVVQGPDGQFISEVQNETVTRKVAAFAGIVESNLWGSAVNAGMDPQVIMKLTEIFAWQIDFNREVQLDDRWRIAVERLFVGDKPIGFGEIIAAEYENAGVVFSAVRYDDETGRQLFFQPDGESLRRLFLKSPLKFGRITSGFSAARFHPVLKVNRPHNGVDYGAPTGTPVMAVGDGTVTFAAMNGASGNMVSIRHNATYETHYKHFSGFAAGVRPGARVEMGQIIGYVGATGLATGPHLHFELHERGRFIDPQGVKFPAADPVPEAEKARFREQSAKGLAELPPWSTAVLTEKRAASSDESERANE